MRRLILAILTVLLLGLPALAGKALPSVPEPAPAPLDRDDGSGGKARPGDREDDDGDEDDDDGEGEEDADEGDDEEDDGASDRDGDDEGDHGDSDRDGDDGASDRDGDEEDEDDEGDHGDSDQDEDEDEESDPRPRHGEGDEEDEGHPDDEVDEDHREDDETYDDDYAYYGLVQATVPEVVVGRRVLIGELALLDFLAPGMRVEVEGRVEDGRIRVKELHVLFPRGWAYYEGPTPEGWARVWFAKGRVWRVQATDPGPRIRLLACFGEEWRGIPEALHPAPHPPRPGLWLLEGLVWQGEVRWTRQTRLGACDE